MNNAKLIGKVALIGVVALLTGVVPGLGFALLGFLLFGQIGWLVGIVIGMSIAYYLGSKFYPILNRLVA